MEQEALPRARPALSRVSQTLVGLAAAALALGLVVHVGLVFLHVAPPNVLSRELTPVINGYIRPEFQQNWKLFAPDPVHVQRDVHARLAVEHPDGRIRVGEWIDLTAYDNEHVSGNLTPSHTRNEFSKGWRSYMSTHDPANRPINTVGRVVERYLKRVALTRISHLVDADEVRRIQLRVTTTRVPEPRWSSRATYAEPSHQQLPWWPVSTADFAEGGER